MFVMGLFEKPLADYSLTDHLGSQNGESADNPILPLPKKAPKILVSGIHADNLGYQCGGCMINWQGLSGNNITSVGETPYAETNGDSLNLTISGNGVETINNVCSGVKCVVVLITSRPVVILPYIDIIEGLVAAWLPGSEGYGVTDVLFGDYGFSGKLPRTWFKSVDQLPMNVGDSHYDPLFPFGFGLSTQGLKFA
ncbi:uncharacterized protein LOC131637371 [Vicia villosa]|uniref:uncharacterized protein LOC131637371 n=1 Tax=Vicia villosa TaxID=3911 RepID=UPI00273C358B|nr:uncharacterized protein LOC131637371 [Vicia villosa]